MTVFVSIKELPEKIGELSERLGSGEKIVVTNEGAPVFDLAPHREEPNAGIDYERGRAFLHSIGIDKPFPYVAADFDDPLPEDFLVRPLPFD